MKNELELQLVKDFPTLFQDYGGDVKHTLMGFGCECSDGWYGIIREACVELEPLAKAWLEAHPEHPESAPRFAQIKEKFGTLCLYMSSSTEEMYAIVRKYENKSATTCEDCGAGDARLRGQGWYYTSCLDCAKPEDYDNFEYLEKAIVKRNANK